jgi:hypothetical protein
MKKISGLILGLAIATATAFAAPCAVNLASAAGCTASLPASAALSTVTGTYAFSGPPATIGASYSESVYADASNPFASGDDTYVLTLTSITGTGIEHVTLSSFLFSPSIDVAFTTGETAPTTITSAGGVISFNFTPSELGAGPGPEYLIVYTSTKTFNGLGTTGIIDGTAGSGVGLQPTSTPEPMSMSLLGGGLALIGVLRLRRK